MGGGALPQDTCYIGSHSVLDQLHHFLNATFTTVSEINILQNNVANALPV